MRVIDKMAQAKNNNELKNIFQNTGLKFFISCNICPYGGNVKCFDFGDKCVMASMEILMSEYKETKEPMTKEKAIKILKHRHLRKDINEIILYLESLNEVQK